MNRMPAANKLYREKAPGKMLLGVCRVDKAQGGCQKWGQEKSNVVC